LSKKRHDDQAVTLTKVPVCSPSALTTGAGVVDALSEGEITVAIWSRNALICDCVSPTDFSATTLRFADSALPCA